MSDLGLVTIRLSPDELREVKDFVAAISDGAAWENDREAREALAREFGA